MFELLIRLKNFEKALVKSLQLKNPVALNSGTSALHLGLVLAGVKPGDEVILPAQTFVATGTAILQQFARPVFADIQYKTGNIDPNSIRRKITKKMNKKTHSGPRCAKAWFALSAHTLPRLALLRCTFSHTSFHRFSVDSRCSI